MDGWTVSLGWSVVCVSSCWCARCASHSPSVEGIVIDHLVHPPILSYLRAHASCSMDGRNIPGIFLSFSLRWGVDIVRPKVLMMGFGCFFVEKNYSIRRFLHPSCDRLSFSTPFAKHTYIHTFHRS